MSGIPYLDREFEKIRILGDFISKEFSKVNDMANEIRQKVAAGLPGHIVRADFQRMIMRRDHASSRLDKMEVSFERLKARIDTLKESPEITPDQVQEYTNMLLALIDGSHRLTVSTKDKPE